MSAFAVTSLMASALGACGGDDATTTAAPGVTTTAPGAALTAKQAGLLARMLFNNRESGGADVTGIIPFGPAATFHINGFVDWKGHTGTFELRTVFADGRPDVVQQVYWTPNEVVLPLEGLEAAMAARGRPGVKYLARTIDPAASPLDQTIRFLGALSSDRTENPLLVRQQADAQFLRAEPVAGVPSEVFRYGKNATYWLPADGLVRRVEARFRSVEGTLVFEFSNRGPKDVQFPTKAEVVRAVNIPEVLAALDAARTAAPPTNAG